jgi:hypothetical protein
MQKGSIFFFAQRRKMLNKICHLLPLQGSDHVLK